MSSETKTELAREHFERALPAVTAEDYTEAVNQSLEDVAADVELAVDLAEREASS